MGLTKMEGIILLELGNETDMQLDLLESRGLNDKQLEDLHQAQRSIKKLNSLLREAL